VLNRLILLLGGGQSLASWLEVIVQLYQRFKEHQLTALAAQLTFYLVLAFFPFLIFLITLLSYFPVANDMPLDQLASIMPWDAYVQVRKIIEETLQARSNTLLSIGMIITIWAASTGVSALISGINKAHCDKETRSFWKVRGLSLLFTLGLALIILFALVMLVLGRIMGESLFATLGADHYFTRIWRYLRYLIPLVTMLLVFNLLYRFSPNLRLSSREVLPGSILASLGWIITSSVFAWYVEHFADYTLIYGSLGGIIILLIWLYLSSVVILVGGELNAVLRSAAGSSG